MYAFKCIHANINIIIVNQYRQKQDNYDCAYMSTTGKWKAAECDKWKKFICGPSGKHTLHIHICPECVE